MTTPRGRFAALRAGRPDRGAALLVPGFTGSKEDFLPVLAPLAGAGFAVVAFDQRGQFESTAPAPPEGWGLTSFAADVLAVAASVADRPVHLLGHSFGGLVAREAALVRPEAFRSLVLLGSGPAGLPGHQAELLLRMADGIEQVGLATVWAIKQSMDRENGWAPPEDPDVAAFLERRFLANDPAGLAAIARLLVSAPDRTDELARVALRVLVAFGQDDDAWSPEIQRETASRLGASCVSIAGAAHSPAVEQPEETARQLVEFWSAAGSRPLRTGGGRR